MKILVGSVDNEKKCDSDQERHPYRDCSDSAKEWADIGVGRRFGMGMIGGSRWG